ncbi:MAG TPA: HEAT repeat domain-containing protein [Chthoniobacterales bacterium]|nr:HEAT repeat domain-containing protein [Chthoniobacterales bacterium]
MLRRNPYKLFDYYTETDANLFFGREVEVSAVAGDILANKLLVLFARSGSGKTSLLNAGIGPALAEVGCVDKDDPGIRMATIRLSGDSTPEQSALKALKPILGSDGPSDSESLHDVLGRVCAFAQPGTPGLQPMGLVLVFDQFEELFITLFRDRPDVRNEFATQLAKIIHDDTLRAYVVLSLRSEYFHHLNEFRGAIPSIFQNNTNLELRPFDDDASLRVINCPAEREGSFAWQKGLPERIVADLKALNEDKDGVLPIHLQIVCYGLLGRLPPEEREITEAHYVRAANNSDKAEGASPADSMIRQRVIGPLDTLKGRNRRRCLYQTLGQLITPRGTKVLRSFSGLCKTIPERRLIPILEYLEERLLLRREASEQETWYELRHDYLAFRIKPWLEAKVNASKASDQWRRGIFIGCLALATTVATKLVFDWNTYTAYLGISDRPDELVIARQPGLGLFAPPWWEREIGTGFPRSEVQAGGVQQFHFDVNQALSSWRDVEPFLQQNPRWTLQLATRLVDQTSAKPAYTPYFEKVNVPQQTSATAAKNTFFEVIHQPEIGLYAAADRHVLEYVISALKSGIASAANALGALGANLPKDQGPAVVGALLSAVRDQSSDVRSSAAYALGALEVNLPEGQGAAVVGALLSAVKDQSSDVRSSAAYVLGALEANLPRDQGLAVVEALLNAVKDQDSNVRRSAAYALKALGGNLPKDQGPAVVEALVNAVKDQDSNVRFSAAYALKTLGANLPEDQAPAVVGALLNAAKDQNSNVRSSAASALGALGANLPKDQGPAVVGALLSAVKDQSSDVRRSAADALKALEANLPKDQGPAVVEALLNAVKDQDSNVRSSAAGALKVLGANLPNDQGPAVVGVLLNAVKDQSSDVRSSAANALGALGAKLPKDQALAVVGVLLNAVKDQSSDVRSSAAGALRALGAKLPKDQALAVVGVLLNAVKDQDSNVRSSAAYALGALGANLPKDQGPAVVEVLLNAVKDQNSNVRSSATEALGALGANLPKDQGPAVVGALLNAAKDQDSNVRSSATEALGALGANLPKDETPAVVEALLNAVKDQYSNVRRSAADALKALGANLPKDQGPAVVGVLLNAVKDQDSNVRRSAASALVLVESHAMAAPSVFFDLDALIYSSNVNDAEIAQDAIHNLASSNWMQSDVELLRDLQGDDSRWRYFALHVLARRHLDVGTREQIRRLRDDEQGRPWVQLAALRCLVEIEREKRLQKQPRGQPSSDVGGI